MHKANALAFGLSALWIFLAAHCHDEPHEPITRLSPSYYASTCDSFSRVVDDVVSSSMLLDPQTPAHLIRLMWHDCAVQGCDASVLLTSIDGSPSERESLDNRLFGTMRGAYSTINTIKSSLESVCPGVVSCADIITAAARSALVKAGGPNIEMRYGRRDGLTSFKAAPDILLPHETYTPSQVCQSFRRLGLSLEDMVALIGTHTIGTANCWKFYDRLGGAFDPRLDPQYAERLNRTCIPPSPGSNGLWAWLNLDNVTSTTFDNQFFKNVLAGQGLLSTDAGLLEFPESQALVAKYASSQVAFFKQYRKSFKKLSELNVLLFPQGDIRLTCDKILPTVE